MQPSYAQLEEQKAGLLGDDENLRRLDDASEDDLESYGAANAFEAKEPRRSGELEYYVASQVKYAWLATYFVFSLLLTLYNKLVLQWVSD